MAECLCKNSSSTTADMSRRGLPIPKMIPSYAIAAMKEIDREGEKERRTVIRVRDRDLRGGKWRGFIVRIGE